MNERTGRLGKQARERSEQQEQNEPEEKSLEVRQTEALEEIVVLLNELLNFLDDRRSPE